MTTPLDSFDWDAYIAPRADKPVSFGVFGVCLKFMKAMDEKNKERNRRIEVLDQRCKALEAELADVKARPQLHDAGVWQAGTVYDAGAIVSFQGSGWICSSTHFAVGDEINHEHFRLFVKHGRDAR